MGRVDKVPGDMQQELLDALADHRKTLEAAELASQKAYDKLAVYLSAGAMALSLAFFSDVVGERPIAVPWALQWAWVSWTGSLVANLTAHYASVHYLRRDIRQVDSGQIPRGSWDKVVNALNMLSGVLFVAGACLFSHFLHRNIMG